MRFLPFLHLILYMDHGKYSLPFDGASYHCRRWFVVGSVLMLFISCFVLAATYYDTALGDDDSSLGRTEFRIEWALLLISGAFFSLGSYAFVRAMHEPHMKPMCTIYHIHTDELIGSWSFSLAVLPAIPYSLIFLKEIGGLVYLGMLFVSVACFLGTLIFVYASYPAVLARNVTQ